MSYNQSSQVREIFEAFVADFPDGNIDKAEFRTLLKEVKLFEVLNMKEFYP